MSIVKMDAFGFTVGGTFRDAELPQIVFNYTLFGFDPGATNLAGNTNALGLWAIRNGVSQAMTDSVALGKDAKVADAIEAWNKKAESLWAGNVPTNGSSSPRIGELERECRMVMVGRLVKAGMSNTDATKTAKNWKAYLTELATQKAEKTGEDRQTIFEMAVLRIEQAAQAVLDARKTPTADELV